MPPGVFRVSPGCLWVSLGVSGCLWVSLGASGCLWVSLGVPGCLWVSLGVSGRLWVSLGVCGCFWMPLVASGCLWALLLSSDACLVILKAERASTSLFLKGPALPTCKFVWPYSRGVMPHLSSAACRVFLELAFGQLFSLMSKFFLTVYLSKVLLPIDVSVEVGLASLWFRV